MKLFFEKVEITPHRVRGPFVTCWKCGIIESKLYRATHYCSHARNLLLVLALPLSLGGVN